MIFFLVMAGTAAAVLAWMLYESQNRQINAHRVSLKKKIQKSLRILHLSDIHFSGPDDRLSRFFDRLAKETYDFIFITGDVFDCEDGIPHAVENLKKLRGRHGIFSVFGNHDYYDYKLYDIGTMGFRGRRHPEKVQPVKKLEKAVREAGAVLLQNESAKVEAEGVIFSIHGLDDPTTGRADIEKAMRGYDPAHINILLSHTIDAFFYIGENEIDLSFSGHSHGGQIRFPFIGPLITHTQYGPKYSQGICSLKGAACSISRGVAASRYFFLRFLCRPEAIVLEVKGPV